MTSAREEKAGFAGALQKHGFWLDVASIKIKGGKKHQGGRAVFEQNVHFHSIKLVSVFVFNWK